jgi:hypothetical protein
MLSLHVHILSYHSGVHDIYVVWTMLSEIGICPCPSRILAPPLAYMYIRTDAMLNWLVVSLTVLTYLEYPFGCDY